MLCAIDPAPPFTMFSCAPFSIENSVSMLPCAWARYSRWRSDTFGQVGRHQAAHRRLEEIARELRADPGFREPRRDRARVPLGRARRGPRRVERDLRGHPVELPLRARERQHREWADLRDQSGVAARASPAHQEMGALHPRLVGGRRPTLSRGEDRVVLRAEPCAAAIDGRAVRERVRPDPAADPIARLEDDDGPSGLAQSMRRREARVPGPTTQTSASMRSSTQQP